MEKGHCGLSVTAAACEKIYAKIQLLERVPECSCFLSCCVKISTFYQGQRPLLDPDCSSKN